MVLQSKMVFSSILQIHTVRDPNILCQVIFFSGFLMKKKEWSKESIGSLIGGK